MILVACHDVGPAKYLTALFRGVSHNVRCLASSLCRRIFLDEGIEEIKLGDLKSIESDLQLVISGTSLKDLDQSIDKYVIKWASERSIPSLAIIEHWSWYAKRFETSSGMLLPNFVLLNDEFALAAAIDEGLPGEILRAFGNPHLESLTEIQFNSVSRYQLRDLYGLPHDKRIIVFISEEIKKCFNENPNDFLGYDEHQVLAKIKSSLIPGDYLLIKMHPEEDPEKYQIHLDNQTGVIIDCPVVNLSILADKVVGMASMLLLELALFRDDVISFRPNNKKFFIGEHLGVTIPVETLNEYLQAINGNVKSANDFKAKFSGSRNKILDFIDMCKR